MTEECVMVVGGNVSCNNIDNLVVGIGHISGVKDSDGGDGRGLLIYL